MAYRRPDNLVEQGQGNLQVMPKQIATKETLIHPGAEAS
jgi:hypothetical protein